ncbi:MAG TPA: redoxin domain-containing protein [Thermoanaerobaculia bacterium]|jgi:peroxiredoxin
MGPIAIGDEAPNFDLSSTEGVLLMLRDEVNQTALVLYFFADPASDGARRDLDALNRSLKDLARQRARVLAISPAKLDDLKKVQVERQLLFPLLHDDRDFSAKYGVAAPEEGKPAAPALVVVSRRQKVLWLANPVAAVDEAMPQVLKLLRTLPSPTASYEKRVINRLVDWWVN